MELNKIIKMSNDWRQKFANVLSKHVEGKNFKNINEMVNTLRTFKGKLGEFLKKEFTQYLISTNQLGEMSYENNSFNAEVVDKAIDNFTNSIISTYNDKEIEFRHIMETKNAQIDREVEDANSGLFLYDPTDVGDLYVMNKVDNVKRKNEIIRINKHNQHQKEYENNLYTFYLQLMRAQMPNYINLFIFMFTQIHHFVLDAFGTPEIKKLGLEDEKTKNIVSNISSIEDVNLVNQALDSIYENHYLCVNVAKSYSLHTQEVFDKLNENYMLSFNMLERFKKIITNCEKYYIYANGNYKEELCTKYYDIFVIAEKLGLKDVETVMNLFIYKFNNVYQLSYKLKESNILKFVGINEFSRSLTIGEVNILRSLHLSYRDIKNIALPVVREDYFIGTDGRYYFSKDFNSDYYEFCTKIERNLSKEGIENAKKEADNVRTTMLKHNKIKSQMKKYSSCYYLYIAGAAVTIIYMIAFLGFFFGESLFGEVGNLLFGLIGLLAGIGSIALPILASNKLNKDESYLPKVDFKRNIKFGFIVAAIALIGIISFMISSYGFGFKPFLKKPGFATAMCIISQGLLIAASVVAVLFNQKSDRLLPEFKRTEEEYDLAVKNSMENIK